MATVKLSELNEFISCPVCQGYLIDATTVNECLHTFCKSCIVKHIKNNHNACPKCNTIIHERRPLDYIILDRNKQDIVYKLVPQLYIAELNKRLASQEMHDIDPTTEKVLKKKYIHVTLTSFRRDHPTNELPLDAQQSTTTTTIGDATTKPNCGAAVTTIHPDAIYLKCPLTVRIYHIRKLLAMKFQLGENDRVSLIYKGDIVSDNDQVSNLAQTLIFCIHYEISRICTRDELLGIQNP